MQWHSNRGIIMRFLKDIFLFGITIALCPPAFAVTKCVKLTPSTTCSGNSGDYGQSNWSATCGGVPIQGVAFGGSQDGGSIGATTDAVTISFTGNDNKYCWCKMVSPAVSRWVFGGAEPSVGVCAYYCVSAAHNNASFRSALFSNLSD